VSLRAVIGHVLPVANGPGLWPGQSSVSSVSCAALLHADLDVVSLCSARFTMESPAGAASSCELVAASALDVHPVSISGVSTCRMHPSLIDAVIISPASLCSSCGAAATAESAQMSGCVTGASVTLCSGRRKLFEASGVVTVPRKYAEAEAASRLQGESTQAAAVQWSASAPRSVTAVAAGPTSNSAERSFAAGDVRAQVLRTISEVLDDGSKGTRVGNYSLMEAGLDSLGVMELRAALQRAIPGLTLPPSMMYDCPNVDDVVSLVTSTVAETAAAASNGVAVYSASMNINVMPMNQAAALALTREQYLFWSHSLMFPSSCAYNMGFVLNFDEAEVDERDLRLAVTRVVEKHPALLVHVSSDGTSQRQPSVSQWKQALARATEIQTLPGLEAAAAVAAGGAEAVTIDHPAVAAACSVAFDITASAPLRFYRAGGRALLLVVHHVVCDASSLSLLAQQLHASHAAIRHARLNGDGDVNVNDKKDKNISTISNEIIRRNSTNNKVQPREAEFGFFVHAAAQAQQSTAALVDKLDHWETLLTAGNGGGAFKPLNLRLDYPLDPNNGNAASAKRPCASIVIDIPPALAAMMRTGAGSQGRTAFSTLISAWALTLRQQAARTASDRPVDDLVFGTAFDLRGITGRGLHSSACQLNLNHF
jgi:acyl carrier protein